MVGYGVRIEGRGSCDVSWNIYSSGDDDGGRDGIVIYWWVGGKAGGGGGGSNLEVWHQNKHGMPNGCGRSLDAGGGGELVATKVVATVL